MTNIGILAFGDCSSLTAIAVNAANSFYTSVNGVLFDKSVSTLIQCPAGLAGNYTVPTGVATIGSDAFADCGLTNVTIPSSVTTIGIYAFDDAGLTSVTIPASVTNIGDGAFAWCYSLTAITVAAQNLFYSGVNGVLFNNSQTTLIQFPAGLSGTYTIPASVTSIEGYAFAGCYGLTNVTIPVGVTTIGNEAFDYCGLTNVTIPGSVTSIGSDAFYNCTSLTSVTIPASVTNIGTYAFDDCISLTNATIPGSVTSIPSGVFEYCPKLASVTIPASVTGIGCTHSMAAPA